MLALSIVFLGVLVVFDSIGQIKLSTEIIVGIFAYLFADILAILYFMIQYINNSQYLQSFRDISHKMLDYLIQDKATTNGNDKVGKPEETSKQNNKQ